MTTKFDHCTVIANADGFIFEYWSGSGRQSNVDTTGSAGDAIKQLGSEGFELVSAVNNSDGVSFYFKRAVAG